MPSMVLTSCPSHWTASVRQAFIRLPSISTVQVPNAPSLQPFLVPVSPRRSRTKSRSVTRGSSSAAIDRPFTFSFHFTAGRARTDRAGGFSTERKGRGAGHDKEAKSRDREPVVIFMPPGFGFQKGGDW